MTVNAPIVACAFYFNFLSLNRPVAIGGINGRLIKAVWSGAINHAIFYVLIIIREPDCVFTLSCSAFWYLIVFYSSKCKFKFFLVFADR